MAPITTAEPEIKETAAPASDEGGYDQGRYGRILLFFGRAILHVILWDLLGGRIPLLRHVVRRTRPERFRRWARRFLSASTCPAHTTC